HVGRVVVCSASELRSISHAKAKTDRRDARELARLLATGTLGSVWIPDERTAALRRQTARRLPLVRQRTRCKNEVHGVLHRNLKGRPPMSDLFGHAGRRWLGGLELSAVERETVASCLRQIDFLDAELAALDRELASSALRFPELARLLTIPGIDLQTAAALLAVIAWHVLWKDEGYAFARPSLTHAKLRRIERLAGVAASASGAPRGQRERERDAAVAAEAAYRRLVADWRAQPSKKARGRTEA